MKIHQTSAWGLTRRSFLAMALGAAGAFKWKAARASAESPRQLSGVALKSVVNWGCQYQKVDLAAIARSNLDMIVLDPSLNDAELQFLTRDQCLALKTKPDGGRRIVLAYLCVGEVGTTRWHWPAEWRETPPAWVGAENPQWPGSRSVQFWNSEWRSLIFGRPNSILARIFDVGFDGVVLDRVDGYADWEAEYPSARRDMVDLVRALASSARAVDPGFIVLVQNAEPLLAHADFVDTIDGHNKESLITGLSSPNVYNTNEDIDWSSKLFAQSATL